MRKQQQNKKQCSNNTHVHKKHETSYSLLYKGVQKVCYTCKTYLCPTVFHITYINELMYSGCGTI